ncbi:MAG: alpha-mannosidase [Bacteroidales bacterium]|jgi:alpha-mannosidase|nr:alpha-mannosidase [Bacteroidales bacterium]
MKRFIFLTGVILSIFFTGSSLAQLQGQNPESPRYDLSVQPVLYTVGYAYLDAEWRWDYEETINVFLKNTLDNNFQLFEKYKPYVFTFSGARRYQMIKEYYPARFEKLKKLVAQGRWFVGGSSVNECDVNISSPESVIRQVLYGNGYFRREFSKQSIDFLLPGCFGFQAHLPSALAHAGIKGFSTRKLVWGSAVAIPFNIGNWTGPDGKGVVAALNATGYGGEVEKRLDTVKYWVDRVMENGKKYGVFADYRYYYGVGDMGGAPRENDVINAVASLNNPDRLINVYLCSSDQLFRDLTNDQKKQLPSYSGDLLLTRHSAGSLTSQSAMKRWNRKNEQLALATEPLAVMADWLGGIDYPQGRLNNAWWLALGSQMHDILSGTSIPKAYEYAWNDEILAMNQFAAGLESSAGVVIRAMDTRGKGKTLVVYNPLAIARKDLVEAHINYPEGVPEWVRVFDGDNNEIPVQIINAGKNRIKIMFLASLPSLGLACYNVVASGQPGRFSTALSAGNNFLENEWLKVSVNTDGDIASIIDKKNGRELLSAPSQLVFQKEHPEYWPAWNMDWNDREKPPFGYVHGPATIGLVESGPVRAALKIERTAENSSFTQYIILISGKEHVQVHNFIDWQSRGVSLKASFPLKVSNPVATYNLGLGTIERSTNNKEKYEVPSREWFDLTDKSGNFGVTIFENCKFGSDKPDDKTLRLTLLYTPTTNFYHDQATQDWGSHEIIYGIYPHKGDWRAGLSEWQGRGLNQPFKAFLAPQHPGSLGKRFSFAQVSVPQVDLRTLKKSEDGKSYILRLQELTGKDFANVEISMAVKITAVWEVDGQEQRIGDATLKNGKLLTDFTKYGIRSFAIQLEPPVEKLIQPSCLEIPIPFDRDVVSSDRNRKDGSFDGQGISIPAELFPETLNINGISFKLGRKADGQNNVVSCNGQKIQFPKTGNFNRVYILASALTDTNGTFKTGNTRINLRIQSYNGKIGQFDKRIWDKIGRIKGLEKGFIKRDEVAWYATHLHKDTLNIPYQYGYIYIYAIDVTPAAGFLQLPENDAIRIFALTVADNLIDQVQPAQALYDDFTDRSVMALKLPKSYVNETMPPAAAIKVTSKRNLSDLPAKLTMKDYADLHQPNGVTVKYFFSRTDTIFKTLENGMDVPAIIDGMYDLLPGDSLKDIWSDKGEGRVWMDLQKETEIDSIHIFTAQDTRRGPQSFSLWGASGVKSPSVKDDPKAAGWNFILLANPADIRGSAKALYTIKDFIDKSNRFRYLMWISEDSPHGPYYFREVDIFEKQQ